MQFDPKTNSFVASGTAILKLDKLHIQASQIQFDPNKQQLQLLNIKELSMPPVTLRASAATATVRPLTLTLQDYEGKYDTQWAKIMVKGTTASCSISHCTFQQSSVHLCPHNPHLLAIYSKNLAVKKDGTVKFEHPSLSINQRTVLKLPKFTLRPPTKPGFLFPRLLWTPSAGLIVGPRFYMPLHQKKFAVAHIAIRSKGGLESSLSLEGPRSHVRLDHALFEASNMGRLRTSLRSKQHHTVAAAQADLVTHKRIIDETSFYPTERAVPHTESQTRFAIEKSSFFLENHATYLQHNRTDETVFQNVDHQTGNIGLHTTILPLYDPALPVQPKLFMSIDRFLVDAQQEEQNHSRFTTATTIQFSRNIGFFSANIETGVLAQRRQIDRTAQSQSRMIPAAAASVGFPLIRRYRRFSHLLNQKILYRIAPVAWGPTPTFQYDVYDMTTQGHHLELTIENTFGTSLFDPFLGFNLSYHHILPQMKQQGLKQLFVMELVTKSPFFQTDAKGGWKLGESTPEFAEIELASKNKGGTGVSTGVFYYGQNSISGATVSSVQSIIWPTRMPPNSTRHTIATEEVSVAINHRFHITAGTQLELYPGIRLSALYYQLDIFSRCRCITASLIAAHIPSSSVPKTMLTLTYQPH